MDMIEMHGKAIKLLESWSPFKVKEFTYHDEVERVINALQQLDSPTDLGKTIQTIYEKSFTVWIPFETCVEISYKLLALKFEAKNIL